MGNGLRFLLDISEIRLQVKGKKEKRKWHGYDGFGKVTYT